MKIIRGHRNKKYLSILVKATNIDTYTVKIFNNKQHAPTNCVYSANNIIGIFDLNNESQNSILRI